MALADAAFASAATTASPPSVAPVRGPADVLLLSDVEAVQGMVRQSHALVYGYQLAIGRLPVVSRQHARAVRELRAQRVLRDRLTDWLRRRSAEVPVASPAYVGSTVPRDASSSALLLRQMQTAFQPFCGLWLAAAGSKAAADPGPVGTGRGIPGCPRVGGAAPGLARIRGCVTAARLHAPCPGRRWCPDRHLGSDVSIDSAEPGAVAVGCRTDAVPAGTSTQEGCAG